MAKKVRKWSNNKKFSTAEKRLHNMKKNSRDNMYPHLLVKYELKGEEK